MITVFGTVQTAILAAHMPVFLDRAGKVERRRDNRTLDGELDGVAGIDRACEWAVACEWQPHAKISLNMLLLLYNAVETH